MASSSFHPPFKCTKAIFVPEIYHEYESEMYDSFIDTYNLYECSKSKKGKEKFLVKKVEFNRFLFKHVFMIVKSIWTNRIGFFIG